MSAFDEDEITDTEDHKIVKCPKCGTKMDDTENTVYKDEFEFKVIVKKIRHRFIETKCPKCGYTTRMEISKNLKEENQYGYGVQALALTLMSEGYVSILEACQIHKNQIYINYYFF